MNTSLKSVLTLKSTYWWLIPLVGFWFSTVSQAEATKGDFWQQAQNIEQIVQQKRLHHNKIELMSFTLSRDLCYLFEFRKNLGIPLHSQNFLKTSFHEITTSDTRLKESIDAWNLMTLFAMQSLFDPEHFNVQLLKTLRYTQGYQRAIAECSQNLGQDIRSVMEGRLQNMILIGAGSTSILSLYGGAGVFSKIFKNKYALKLFHRFPKFSKISLATLGIGSTAYVSHMLYQLKRESDQHQILTDSIADGANQEFLGFENHTQHIWEIRKYRYYAFIKDYQNKLDAINLENLDNQKLVQLFGEELMTELDYLNKQLGNIIAKKEELHAELSTGPHVSQRIHSLLEKQRQGIDLNLEETAFFEKAQFYGALKYIESILNIINQQPK